MTKRILVCPGHGKSASGGYDPGATANGYEEYNLACELARRVETALLQYDVLTTRINDNRDYYLLDRINFANRKGFDLVAEIHLNAGKGTGSEVYYAQNSGSGKRLAENLSEGISAALGIRNRGAKTKVDENGKDYFGIIRSTEAEAVLIETCFIDSDDVNRLVAGEYIDKVAAAIAQALAKAVSAEKKPHSTPNENEKPTEEKPTAPKVSEQVLFLGGNIYLSANAPKPAVKRPQSSCIVTKISDGSAHPVHLVSKDGGNVYGWVNEKDIKESAFPAIGSGGNKLKAGMRVMLRNGALTYTGGKLAAFVYKRPHVIEEISGNRAVITFNGIVIAAVRTEDLVEI